MLVVCRLLRKNTFLACQQEYWICDKNNSNSHCIFIRYWMSDVICYFHFVFICECVCVYVRVWILSLSFVLLLHRSSIRIVVRGKTIEEHVDNVSSFARRFGFCSYILTHRMEKKIPHRKIATSTTLAYANNEHAHRRYAKRYFIINFLYACPLPYSILKLNALAIVIFWCFLFFVFLCLFFVWNIIGVIWTMCICTGN